MLVINSRCSWVAVGHSQTHTSQHLVFQFTLYTLSTLQYNSKHPFLPQPSMHNPCVCEGPTVPVPGRCERAGDCGTVDWDEGREISIYYSPSSDLCLCKTCPRKGRTRKSAIVFFFSIALFSFSYSCSPSTTPSAPSSSFHFSLSLSPAMWWFSIASVSEVYKLTPCHIPARPNSALSVCVYVCLTKAFYGPSGQNHIGKKRRNWRKGTEAGHVGGEIGPWIGQQTPQYQGGESFLETFCACVCLCWIELCGFGFLNVWQQIYCKTSLYMYYNEPRGGISDFVHE